MLGAEVWGQWTNKNLQEIYLLLFLFCVQLPAHSFHSRGHHLKLSWLCCALNFHYFIAKSEAEVFFICQIRCLIENESLQWHGSGWTGSDSWVCTEDFPYAGFGAVKAICLNLGDENTFFNPLENLNPSLQLDFTQSYLTYLMMTVERHEES